MRISTIMRQEIDYAYHADGLLLLIVNTERLQGRP
jgi:hypothetical protein